MFQDQSALSSSAEEALCRVSWRLAIKIRDQFLYHSLNHLSNDDDEALLRRLREDSTYRGWAEAGLARRLRGLPHTQRLVEIAHDHAANVEAARRDVGELTSLTTDKPRAVASLRRLVGCYLFLHRVGPGQSRGELRFPFLPKDEWLLAEHPGSPTHFSDLFGWYRPEVALSELRAWRRRSEKQGRGLETELEDPDPRIGIRSLKPAVWRDVSKVDQSKDSEVDYPLGHRNMLIWPLGPQYDAVPEPRNTRALVLLFSPCEGLIDALLGLPAICQSKDLHEPVLWEDLPGVDQHVFQKRVGFPEEAHWWLLEVIDATFDIGQVASSIAGALASIVSHKFQRLRYLKQHLLDLRRPGFSERERQLGVSMALIQIDKVQQSIHRDFENLRESQTGVRPISLKDCLRDLIEDELAMFPFAALLVGGERLEVEAFESWPGVAETTEIPVDLGSARFAILELVINATEEITRRRDEPERAEADEDFLIAVRFDVEPDGIQVVVEDNARVARIPDEVRHLPVKPPGKRGLEAVKWALQTAYEEPLVIETDGPRGWEARFRIPFTKE